MAAAKICGGIRCVDDFDKLCAELDYRDYLNERKETRRHQSLNKSIDNGFHFADDNIANTVQEAERQEIISELKRILKCLSDRQRFVLVKYTLDKMSFREIGDELGLHKHTIREHYYASVKKLQKFLKKHPSKLPLSWLLGEGLKKPYLKKRRTLYGTKQTTTNENYTCEDKGGPKGD